MITVTISQLKNRLSAYLKRVRSGETVLILDRQEPVAVLERIEPSAHPSERLVRLEQSGIIRRSKRGDPLQALAGIGLSASKRSVVEALLEERREGR